MSYACFVVMHSCAPNSDVRTGLQYTYSNVVSENDLCVSGVIAMQSDLSCNSTNQNVAGSFQVMCVKYAQNVILERDCHVFGAITCQTYLACSSDPENRHL